MPKKKKSEIKEIPKVRRVLLLRSVWGTFVTAVDMGSTNSSLERTRMNTFTLYLIKHISYTSHLLPATHTFILIP